MFVEDVLIPVKYLINNIGSVPVPSGELACYHVELPPDAADCRA